MSDLKAVSAAIDSFLTTGWVQVIILPAGAGLFALAKYLFKRKVERKPENETLDELHKVMDLQAKLINNKMSISDLAQLRAQALGIAAENAITVAEISSTTAEKLVHSYRNVVTKELSSTADSYSEEMTQTEMNILSGQKAAQADDELAAVIDNISHNLSPEAFSALNNSQEAWSDFRRWEIERESLKWTGGTIQPLMVNSKYEAMTQERIIALSSGDSGLATAITTVSQNVAPVNIFDLIEIGTPSERVRDILGVPNYQFSSSWCYRFSDVQVEVSLNEVGSVSELVVALIEGQTYSGTSPGYMASKPLGVLTLADILESDDQIKVEYFLSMRTEEIFVRGRIGPPGAWTSFCFGSLKVHSGAGQLKEVDFDWSQEEGKLLSDPNDIIINWMSYGSVEIPTFSWFIK